MGAKTSETGDSGQTRRHIVQAMGQLRLPRHAEMPDLPLYMDQLLICAERALAPVRNPEEKPLSASMVNNYVKHGALPAARGKRYGRDHLARLIFICLAKRAFSIARITQMMDLVSDGPTTGTAAYDRFCALFEARLRELAAADSVPADAGAGPAAPNATYTDEEAARIPEAEGPEPTSRDLLAITAEALARVIYIDSFLAATPGH